jgi:nucleoside 2-deoxyribosyltransferase
MINKQKIYVAGPYTNGDIVINIREAIAEGNILLEYGFIPFIPHLTGFWHMLFPNTYDTWMEYDAEWLKSCDALLRIDGISAGADVEVRLAEELGIPVFYDRASLGKYFTEND